MSKKAAFGVLLAAAGAAGAAGFFVIAGGESARIDHTDAQLVALGARVYGDACASCHGVNLEGQGDWRRRLADGSLPAPPHDASGHTWHHPDRVLFDYTKVGGAAVAPPGFRSTMPGFGGTLTDREIWAALSFIKSRWPAKIKERHTELNERAR